MKNSVVIIKINQEFMLDYYTKKYKIMKEYPFIQLNIQQVSVSLVYEVFEECLVEQCQ
jgi:hypothetical protein